MTPIDLDLGEAHVPTKLVQRPRRTGGASSQGSALFVVGPYSVARGLVRAPGAWIVEASGPNGEAVLLQLVHLRALVSEAERAARSHLEQTVLARTTALLAEPDRVVLAHGGVDRADGTRVLFWALPVPPQVERLANPLRHLSCLDHLLAAGIDVARRLAHRHQTQRFEPILSEHLFLVTDDGAELVGVPVQVPSEWMAEDMPAPRLAPEEVANGNLTALGDVWRLGQALSVLGCAFEPLPEAVRKLFDRMSGQVASARPPRASELAVELEALRQQLDGSTPLGDGQATVAMTLALSQDAVTELMMRAMAESTNVEAHVPVMAAGEAEVPAWAFFFEPAAFQLFERVVARSAPAPLTEAERAELARLCRGQPNDRWASLVHSYFSQEESTLFGSVIPDATIVDATMDPAEVAETRAVTPLVFVPDPIPPPIAMEESVEVPLPSYEEEEEPEPIHPKRRWWVLGSLAGLALLGAAALAAGRPGTPGIPVHLDRAVVIEAENEGALIVGEDGTLLGSGPISIVMPEEGEVAVLVTARGYRPERIVLPSAGALRVTLAPLENHERCTLEVPPGIGVEGVGFELDRSTVEGAAVVRARKGQATRANIVRCGGAVRVEVPSAAQAELTAVDGTLLDGEPVQGRKQVAAGFHRIAVDGEERWLPAFRAVELRR